MRAGAVGVLGWALVCSISPALAQQTPVVQMALSKQSVHVGEPITLRLQISTTSRVAAPDLSGWKDFSVRQTGSMNSSGGTTIIINGRPVQRGNASQIYDYELIARKTGALQLPAIKVTVDGTTHSTPARTIVSQAPPDLPDFKLRLSTPKMTAYVGEPIEVSLVFYYRAQLKNNIQTTMSPFDKLDAFHVYDPDGEQGAGGRVEILDGRQYNTHVFRKILIPKSSGAADLGMATIVFYAKTGERNVRNFFGQVVREPVYERQIVASQPMMLNVLDVPSAGRPSSFAGHIGEYEIQAQASPTEVNVGDPITLTVALSGPPHLDHVKLPALAEQPQLAALFKIPVERESGKVQGSRKVFTQTIRALNEAVSEIPPIELPFFDTRAGEYRIAKSQAIPLTVNATRVVTASDAEGLTPLGQTSDVEAVTQGIAHNYEGLDVLESQVFGPRVWLKSPGSLALLGAPPVVYVGLLILVVTMRQRNADPLAVKSRKALGELNEALPKVNDLDGVLKVFRDYLGAKLRRTSGALTYADVRDSLEEKAVGEELLNRVKRVFETCEASRYAGAAGGKPEAMVRECHELAQELEEALK